VWGFFFIAPHNYNAASGPPVRASGGRVMAQTHCLRLLERSNYLLGRRVADV